MAEPVAEIAYWVSQIDALKAAANESCGDMPSQTFTERPFLEARFSAAVMICAPDLSAARDAVSGMSDPQIEALAEDANASLTRLTANLRFQALPNVTSLEIAALIAKDVLGHLANEQAAIEVLNRPNRTKDEMGRAAIQFLEISRVIPLVDHFVTTSFRNEGSCTATEAPATAPLRDDLKRLSENMSRVESEGGEFLQRWWPEAPQAYLQGTSDRVRSADAQGWWYYNHGVATDLSLFSALLQAAEEVRKPSREMTIALHQENLDVPRTIWTDKWLFAADGMEDPEHWELNEHGHWFALAYRETEWVFADAPCATR